MFVNYCLRLINCGLMLGLILSVMLLLRPVLKRVLSPQQRLWVWIAGWFYGWRALLDFGLLYQWNVDRFQTFQNLVTPRTAGFLGGTPAFLPGEYEGPGAYHIALPGGNLIQTELTDWMVYALCLLWVAGAVGMLVWFWRQNRRLIQLGRQGTLMDENDPRIADYKNGKYPVSELKVYITPNLPTSFVSRNWFDYSYEVYLQQELSPERMDLVLTHELRHIDLLHCWWKAVATLSLALFWWNPLVWLSFRCFCLDVELACDESVMKRLTPSSARSTPELCWSWGRGGSCGTRPWPSASATAPFESRSWWPGKSGNGTASSPPGALRRR